MGLTVVVVLVVLAVIAAVALLAVQGRRRRQEQQRIEAAEHRHEAEIRSASAQRREAEASERAARAEREQAQAREQAARARQDREAAEERHAAADRIDPDRGDPDRGDPAAQTDDLRLGRHDGSQHPHPEQDRPEPAAGGRHHGTPPVAGRTDGQRPDREEDGPGPMQAGPPAAAFGGADRQPHQQGAVQADDAGQHAAPASPSQSEGRDADPAARTDDLRLDPARDEQGSRRDAPGESSGSQGGGWHGPSASGGYPAVDPAAPAGPAQGGPRPTPDAPTGRGDAPGQAVPAQRTGEHDRDRRETADDEHSGPVRALADRLLRRRG